MSRSVHYKKMKGAKGISQHKSTYHYMSEKRIKGKLYSMTFVSLFEAKEWIKKFDGNVIQTSVRLESSFATLKEVWEMMQLKHFPLLATSTKEIWRRRYKLLERIENLPMDQITPSKITEWVMFWVEHFKTDEYQNSGRGTAGR